MDTNKHHVQYFKNNGHITFICSFFAHVNNVVCFIYHFISTHPKKIQIKIRVGYLYFKFAN